MTTNQQRTLDISKKLGLSHIGSNLSCLPILEEVYSKKNPRDIVILDNAHAHLAHLVVKYPETAESMVRDHRDYIAESIEEHGIHCDRDAGCDASGGSLGHGLGIGIGYALADPNRDVYVVVSDGSMMEGSNWEALRIAGELDIPNLFIHCNFNGYTAVRKTDYGFNVNRMSLYTGFWGYHHITYHKASNTEDFEGVKGHYQVIK